MSSIQLASGLAVVNIVLLGLLTAVWVRNYRKFRSSLVAGLLAFAVVMLAENVTALYFFFSMKMLYSGDPTVQWAVLVLRGMQLVALAFLTWVTMK
ncbi:MULTISPECIES: hypothetical protein [Halorussus]|uniref:hypothetical protein n=1 Tax=Halorussus TaxID=1070314 RepID=UPI0020A2032C|nr:hypothetical protein [Halorussus vallis]USZ76974.1 hypothetical protein NGM07_06500 [Halorussus vallis]